MQTTLKSINRIEIQEQPFQTQFYLQENNLEGNGHKIPIIHFDLKSLMIQLVLTETTTPELVETIRGKIHQWKIIIAFYYQSALFNLALFEFRNLIEVSKVKLTKIRGWMNYYCKFHKMDYNRSLVLAQ